MPVLKYGKAIPVYGAVRRSALRRQTKERHDAAVVRALVPALRPPQANERKE